MCYATRQLPDPVPSQQPLGGPATVSARWRGGLAVSSCIVILSSSLWWTSIDAIGINGDMLESTKHRVSSRLLHVPESDTCSRGIVSLTALTLRPLQACSNELRASHGLCISLTDGLCKPLTRATSLFQNIKINSAGLLCRGGPHRAIETCSCDEQDLKFAALWRGRAMRSRRYAISMSVSRALLSHTTAQRNDK